LQSEYKEIWELTLELGEGLMDGQAIKEGAKAATLP